MRKGADGTPMADLRSNKTCYQKKVPERVPAVPRALHKPCSPALAEMELAAMTVRNLEQVPAHDMPPRCCSEWTLPLLA